VTNRHDPLVFKNIDAVPSIHQRISFAAIVRKKILSEKYDCVCVELPAFCKNKLLEAASKLPAVNILSIEESKEDNLSFIPVEPTDSLVTGANLAVQMELPLYFIDKGKPCLQPGDTAFMPDDYTVTKIGLQKYYTCYLTTHTEDSEKTGDTNREKHMAYELKKIMPRYKKILLVCGLAHWENIKFYLRYTSSNLKPELPAYLPQSTTIYHVSQTSLKYILQEIPYVAAYYYKTLSEKKPFSKLNALAALLQESIKKYPFTVSPSQLKNISRYLFRLNLQEHRLMPDLLNLVAAAKQCVNDDFGRIVYHTAAGYYYYQHSQDYPPIDFTASFYHYEYKGAAPRKRFPLRHSLEYLKIFKNSNLATSAAELPLENRLELLCRQAQKKHVKARPQKKSFIARTIIPNKKIIKNKNITRNSIVIFDDELDGFYPLRNILPTTDFKLLFYAQSPLLDSVASGANNALFGGYAVIRNHLPELRLQTRKELTRSNSDILFYNTIMFTPDKSGIDYFSYRPPRPDLMQLANHCQKQVRFFNLNRFASDHVNELRKIANLTPQNYKKLFALV